MSGYNYNLDPKDPRDTDAVIFDLSVWLGGDSLLQTPTASVSPTDMQITNVSATGSTVRVTVSGGSVANSPYKVTLNILTTGGRNVFRSVSLPVAAR